MHVPSSVCLHSVQYFYHVSFSCMSSFARIHWLPAHFFSCVLLLSCLILHRFVDLLWSRLSLYTLSSHSIQLIAVYWKTSFVATVRDIILCIHKNFSSHLMMLLLLPVFFSSVHRQTSSLLWLISCILNILTKVIEKSM